MCDYPQNLSILIRGGRETNRDSLSSCERNGRSPARRDGVETRLSGSVYWTGPLSIMYSVHQV